MYKQGAYWGYGVLAVGVRGSDEIGEASWDGSRKRSSVKGGEGAGGGSN